MTADYGVTSGHELYSTHRFRDDTKHMIIFDTIDDDRSPHGGHNRTRLYLTDERRCCDQQTVIQRFEKSRSRRIYPASKNTVLCSAGIGAEPQQAKESPTSASAEMGDLGRLYIQRHCLPLSKLPQKRPITPL